jgi:Fe2+ transport system protein FeoA
MNRRAHLQAYGLVPGHWVEVVQHSPVTIVLVDYTELALERDMARRVAVEL